jgi:hypothetical protein
MVSAFTSAKTLPVLAVGAFAAASYPPIPADLTTPVQQRIAVNGPNSRFIQTVSCKKAYRSILIVENRCFNWVEHLSAT